MCCIHNVQTHQRISKCPNVKWGFGQKFYSVYNSITYKFGWHTIFTIGNCVDFMVQTYTKYNIIHRCGDGGPFSFQAMHTTLNRTIHEKWNAILNILNPFAFSFNFLSSVSNFSGKYTGDYARHYTLHVFCVYISNVQYKWIALRHRIYTFVYIMWG